MKNVFLLLFAFWSFDAMAQNIGIGTETPAKKLTVNGSILLDENNTNDGALDSAALMFGTNGGVGIASKKTSAGWQNGLSIFTNSFPRLTVESNGNVGINYINPTSALHVGGTIRTTTDLWAAGNGRFDNRVAIGGAGLPEYKLYNTGHSYFGGAVDVNNTLNVNGTSLLNGVLSVEGYTTIDDGVRINGKLGINGPSGNTYGISVHNLPSYFNGDVTITKDASVSSTLNVGGDGIIDNNFRVNGRVGIGGPTHGSYGLMVNNSNSFFEGSATVQNNLTVQGNTNLQGDVTIQGNGHVRSNGNSSLRISFESKQVLGGYNPHQEKVVTVNLPAFDGSANNIRVNISSFEPLPSSNTSSFKWYIYDVDPVSDTCKIRIINQDNDYRFLDGTFYLTVIVKD